MDPVPWDFPFNLLHGSRPRNYLGLAVGAGLIIALMVYCKIKYRRRFSILQDEVFGAFVMIAGAVVAIRAVAWLTFGA